MSRSPRRKYSRGLALPDRLYELLVEHEAAQAKEREHAGTAWHGEDWMFSQPDGKPLDPRRDRDAWKDLLTQAGVRDARLHDARHTAATTLLVHGVDKRVVMDFMGWSTAAMKKRYQHVVDQLRDDVADGLNQHLWGS